MATIASLLVSIETNMAQFTTDMNKMSNTVDSAMNKMTGAVRGFQNVLAGVAVGAVFHELVAASAEAELSMKKVEQVIRSTGGVAGVTASQVQQISTALQKQTGASDDALNSAQALLLTFTKVGKEVFPDAVNVINDMSKALGQDMQSSTIQLGKALNDPIKGVTALQRVGVSFTAAQKEQIKALVESGRALDAQKMILSELQTEFGGAAAAARDTLGGAFDALKNQTGELFEALGGGGNNGGLRYIVELCLAAMENLTDGVGELQNWFNSSQSSALQFREGLAAVGEIAGGVWETFKLGANVIISWGDALLNEVLPNVLKGMQQFAEVAYDTLVRKPTGGLSDLVLNFAGTFTSALVEGIPAGIQKGAAVMDKQGKDYIGAFADPVMKGLGDLHKQVDERMKLISAAANKSKVHLPKDLDDVGGGVDKKEHDKASRKWAQQQNSIDGIVAGYQKMNQELEGKLHKQEDEVKLAQAIEKINKNDMIGTMEKLVAITQVTAEYEKMKQTKIEMAKVKEEDELKDLLTSLKEKSAEMEAQLTGQKGITETMKIEAELQKILKDAKGEHLGIVEEIRKEEERIANLGLEQKRQDELKSVKEITDSYQDQIQALDAKVRGYDDSLELIKQERKIMEEMKNLSPEDKAKAIGDIERLHYQTQQYNNVLKSQETLVSDIMGSNAGYYNQVKDLQEALQGGQINLKQYEESMSKLNKSQKEVSETGKQFGGTITKGLQDMIFEGKKATDVFKNMGKELLKMAAQKLIFNPLQEKLGLAFDAAGRNLFGLGKTPGVGGAGTQPSWSPGFNTPQNWTPQPNFANSGGSSGGYGLGIGSQPVNSKDLAISGYNIYINGTNIAYGNGGGSPNGGTWPMLNAPPMMPISVPMNLGRSPAGLAGMLAGLMGGSHPDTSAGDRDVLESEYMRRKMTDGMDETGQKLKDLDYYLTDINKGAKELGITFLKPGEKPPKLTAAQQLESQRAAIETEWYLRKSRGQGDASGKPLQSLDFYTKDVASGSAALEMKFENAADPLIKAMQPLSGLLRGLGGGGGAMGMLAGLVPGSTGNILSGLMPTLQSVLGSGLIGGISNMLKGVFSGGLFNTLTNSIQKLFSGGIFNGLSGLVNSLFGSGGGIFGGIINSVKNLFGGGSGGGLLSGLGGLTNITGQGGLLSTMFAPLSGVFGGLKSLSGLGNIFGGGGLFDVMTRPIRGYALGGRPTPNQPAMIGDGGDGSGKELWWPDAAGTIIPQNQAIDLLAAFAGTRSGLFGKSQDQDYNGIINNFNGTPLYQQDPNFRPNLPADIQYEIEKNEAFQRMNRSAYMGQYGEMPNMSKVVAFYNTLPEEINPDMQDWFRDSVKANAEARLARNPLDNFASDTLANKTFTSVMASQKYGMFALPAGDQMSRMLMNWTHRGVNPSTRLMEYAMTRDYLSGIINPSGSWQGSSFGYKSSGMTWGAGAGGAVMTGDGGNRNSWTGVAPKMVLDGGQWVSLADQSQNSSPLWGQRNSGLPDWLKPNPSPSSVPYAGGPIFGGGKGLGGPNPSKLIPPTTANGTPLGETGGLLDRLQRMFGANGSQKTNYPSQVPDASMSPSEMNRLMNEYLMPDNVKQFVDGSIASTLKSMHESLNAWDPQKGGAGSGMANSFGKFLNNVFGPLFGPEGSKPIQSIHGPIGGFLDGPITPIRGRASGGGIDAMNMYEVGENGREFIFSGSRGQVVSNAAAEAALKGGGAPQIQVINQTRGTVAQPDVQISPEGVARIVLREIQQAVGGRMPGRRGS